MTKSMFLRICVFSVFLLASCSPSPLQEAMASPTPIGLSPIQLTQGVSTLMPTDLQTPTGSSLDILIEKAKEDLAQRLSISATQITLVEATEIEWSDSSLGCPQPGMEYLQVITPGYRISLEAGGVQYEYHSNRDTYVIYCENTNPPILPKP